MKLITILHDRDITGEQRAFRGSRRRRGARTVLFNEEGKIALLKVKKQHCHKLPGGGIEKGESIHEALKREVREETGFNMRARAEVGKIIELRSDYGLKQDSYCFIGETIGTQGKMRFTAKEKALGYSLIWVSIDKALELIHKDNPKDYTPRFVQKREILFLKEAKKLLGKIR